MAANDHFGDTAPGKVLRLTASAMAKIVDVGFVAVFAPPPERRGFSADALHAHATSAIDNTMADLVRALAGLDLVPAADQSGAPVGATSVGENRETEAPRGAGGGEGEQPRQADPSTPAAAPSTDADLEAEEEEEDRQRQARRPTLAVAFSTTDPLP